MEDECRRLAREGEKVTRFGDANKGYYLKKILRNFFYCLNF